MKQSDYKNQKGTALIVTIILAGAISLVAFGMTKVALNELFVGNKVEEGLEAYYAAQAGIEDGLMRYKFHDKSEFSLPDNADKDSKAVMRVYINKNAGDSGKVVRIANPDANHPNLTALDYVYDLKVWSKQVCAAEKPCEFEIEKDKSIILDVSDVQNIRLSWNLYNKKGDLVAIDNSFENEQRNTGFWYRLYDGLNSDPRDLGRDFFTMLSYYNNIHNPSNPPAPPLLRGSYGTIQTNGAKTLKLKSFISSTINGHTPPNTELPLRIKINILSDRTIGGPKTYIESTGYYGDTAKKIVAVVDRESKSIIDVFDYVIYSGRGPLPR